MAPKEFRVWTGSGFIYSKIGELDNCSYEDLDWFTGKIDSNGIKIFEGDYIQYGDRILRVRWNETEAMFDFDGIRPSYGCNGKVIGNHREHHFVKENCKWVLKKKVS